MRPGFTSLFLNMTARSICQVDAEPDDEDENEIPLDEDEDEEEGGGRSGGQAKKKLPKDRNRWGQQDSGRPMTMPPCQAICA